MSVDAAPLSMGERGAIWARSWSLIRERFVDQATLGKVDWESQFSKTLRELENAPNDVEYWRKLRTKVCALNNGRTQIKFPGDLPQIYDLVPIKMILVGNKVLVSRLSSSPDVQASQVQVGDELVAVDGVPALEFIRTECMPHTPGSREGARLASAVSRVLTGDVNSKAQLQMRTPSGREYQTSLIRSSGPYFKYWQDLGEPNDDDVRLIDGKYQYINAGFNFTWDLESVIMTSLDTDKPPDALILDLRETDSGIVSEGVLSRLAFFPLPLNEHRTLRMVLVRSQFQQGAMDWDHVMDTVAARMVAPEGRKYEGKVIVLVSPLTSGPAEQLIEPLVFAQRAILVGDTTAGAGHSFAVLPLGSGAMLSVAITEPIWENGHGNGSGFPPSILAQPTALGMSQGRDEILERALELLRK